MAEQFLGFIDYDLNMNIVKFENFSGDDTNLYDFYFRFIGIEKYKKLSFLVKIFLTLSHGQAAGEHNFSLAMSFLLDNISEASMINKIKDHMFANNLL